MHVRAPRPTFGNKDPALMNAKPIVGPHNLLKPKLEGPNIFQAFFGELGPDAWCDTLVRSMHESTIEGVEFPAFPPPELQVNIHGHHGETSLREACDFYRFVVSHNGRSAGRTYSPTGCFLDFGCGWGRITRLFMRDFPLKNMLGYEPSARFCAVARSLNPFVAFIQGSTMPDAALPANRFDLIVGWSVFSHLSRGCAAAWLNEFERVLRPGGTIVMTTWGERFITRLIQEKDLMNAGEEINWYSKICIEGGGNLQHQLEQLGRGEFVWFDSVASDTYGEAFMSAGALDSLIRESAPSLHLKRFDTSTLVQDTFVLVKD